MSPGGSMREPAEADEDRSDGREPGRETATPHAIDDDPSARMTPDAVTRPLPRVDPRDIGDGRRIPAEDVPPRPIAPSRPGALGTFLPLAMLVCALAAAIYLWARA